MVFLKYLLLWGGAGMMAAAIAMLARDLYLTTKHKESLSAGAAAGPAPGLAPGPAPEVHWRGALALAVVGWGPILVAMGIFVVPSGMAGVRVSQLFTTESGENSKSASTTAVAESDLLRVQTKEGIPLGLAITIRYRLGPKHLDYIQANLPQPVEKEIVPPVVASAWRELAPNYTVREMFATHREEIRQKAANVITQKLAADGIIAKEVILRDIQLPTAMSRSSREL